MDSISHRDDPLQCKSSACVDARALITDLQTSQNLQRCLPSAVRRRAKVRVEPNELLALSQEFYEVPEVRPELAPEPEWSITRWHLMIAGCSPLSHGCCQKKKHPSTQKRGTLEAWETIFIASPDRFRHLHQIFACKPVSCVVLLHSKTSIVILACYFLVWFYLEIIRNKNTSLQKVWWWDQMRQMQMLRYWIRRCFLSPVKCRNVPPNADNGDVLWHLLLATLNGIPHAASCSVS